MKRQMTRIFRFRLPDDIVEVLGKMKRKSEFVRCAIREKMEREGLLKEYKLPF